MLKADTELDLDLYWNEEERGLMVGSKIVNFTRVEWKFLSTLRSFKPITYEYLAHSIYRRNRDKMARIYMDKYIDRIRAKLRGTGLYVYCVLGYGYVLWPGAAVKRKAAAL